MDFRLKDTQGGSRVGNIFELLIGLIEIMTFGYRQALRLLSFGVRC